MTVKQLIKKLKNVPDDALVIMRNNDLFADGEYKVTDVEYYNCDNTVEIVTDYEERIYE